MSSLAFTTYSTNAILQNFSNTADTTLYNTANNTARKFDNFVLSQLWVRQWLGQSKSQILQALQDKNLASVGFASWLAVPSLGILIKFHHQICHNIDYY